jgi:hypothetical protein
MFANSAGKKGGNKPKNKPSFLLATSPLFAFAASLWRI